MLIVVDDVLVEQELSEFRAAYDSLPFGDGRATAGERAAEVKRKQGPGVGTYLAIGAGVIAAAGVAYAVWQTFRADDELWVADEEPGTASDSGPAPSPVI